MNEQEVAQNEKIERLFLKFDTDGSGALDSNELYELFKEN
jgi:Ca2+-binding EF-hand superfamily protein